MSSSSQLAVQVINVGTPHHPTGWSSAHIKFHNFSHLQHSRGQSLDSPIFRIHNVDWYLRVYPRGQDKFAVEDSEECVSLYLRCKTAAEHHHAAAGNGGIQAEFSLALYRTDQTLSHITTCPINKFGKKRKGWPEFISRTELFDRNNRLLDDLGTLCVVVSIQLYQVKNERLVGASNAADEECDITSQKEYFVPNVERSVNRRLLQLWEDANPNDDDDYSKREMLASDDDSNDEDERNSTINSTDITFDIDGENLYAHRLILSAMSPTLASICSSSGDDDGNCHAIIPIFGVRLKIFRCLLRYLYGGAIPEEIWSSTSTDIGSKSDSDDPQCNNNLFQHASMELLDASNRYGVVDLKIQAEVHIVQSLINVANASDLFLYADGNDCALLKECVIDYFKVHAQEIRSHPSFQKVKESTDIMDQLMEALTSSRALRSWTLNEKDEDYEMMSVDLLRRKLYERELSMDGSREVLIRRLVKWDNTSHKSRN